MKILLLVLWLFHTSVATSFAIDPILPIITSNMDTGTGSPALTHVNYNDLIVRMNSWSVVPVSSYKSLTAAVVAIGAKESTLLINVPTTITSATVIPANIHIKIQKPGLIVSNYALTVNGHLSAGLDRLFSGNGTISIVSGTVKEFYPEWWGAVANGDNDDTIAIQNAIDSASASNGTVFFSPKVYAVNPLRLGLSFPSRSTYAFEMRSNMHIKFADGATLKIKDASSTDLAPKYFTMFASASALSNISFIGNGILDGNFANNPISPSRPTYNRYNQAFIAFWGNSARGDDVVIDGLMFKNNPGMNNIIMGNPRGIASIALGKRWLVQNTKHIDGGLDTDDFTAIFGYAEDVTIINNHFSQNISPTVYNGVGARNAYEVHGSRQIFSHNTIKSYFGGVIVNSNYTSNVSDVTVSHNKFTDMFLYGVRLWRQASQTSISQISIANNYIQLNSTLYSTATTIKAGIYAASNFILGVTGVSILNNQIYQEASPTNVSAIVYIAGQTTPGEKHDRFTIAGNKGKGTYYGIVVLPSINGATFGTVAIQNNEIKNLKNVGTNINPIAIYIRGNSTIDYALVENNIIEDDSSGTTETKYGLWLQGAITRTKLQGNRFTNVTKPLTHISPK